MKYLIILIALFTTACSSEPYFVKIENESNTSAALINQYGNGSFVYFYSHYPMAEDDKNNEYMRYFEYVSKEVKSKSICNKEFEILKESLSYFDEGGYVTIIIRCL